MPRHEIEFHPQAVMEARAAREWYEARSPKAAISFIRELDHAIEQIAKSPRRWPLYIKETRRFLFRRFPFFVVYREVDDTIQVLAVAHGHRRPGYWQTR